jgi:hypothetical protein
MPAVEFCARCRKEIDEQAEKYVVLQEAHNKAAPRVVAHVSCTSQPTNRPRVGYPTFSKGL